MIHPVKQKASLFHSEHGISSESFRKLEGMMKISNTNIYKIVKLFS